MEIPDVWQEIGVIYRYLRNRNLTNNNQFDRKEMAMKTNSTIKVYKTITFLTLLFWGAHNTTAQVTDRTMPHGEHALDSMISRIMGQHDDLVNGFYHTLPDPRIQGHPYFEDDWKDATLFIRENVFSGIPIKYELVSEQIIIKVADGKQAGRLININKAQIDSFYYGSVAFLSSRIFFPDQEQIFFFEKVVRGELSLVKKHSRQFIGLYNGMTPQGRFSGRKENLFLIMDNTLYPADSKAMFIRSFGKEYRKSVGKLIRDKDINYKTASAEQFAGLLTDCALLVNGIF